MQGAGWLLTAVAPLITEAGLWGMRVSAAVALGL